MLRQRAEVDAGAGDDGHASRACRRAVLAAGAQAGDRPGPASHRLAAELPIAPSKMMLIASPRIFGPDDRERDADDGEAGRRATMRGARAEGGRAGAGTSPGSPWPWPAAGPCPCPSCPPGPAARVGRAGAPAAGSLPPPGAAHAACASSLGQLRVARSRGRSRSSRAARRGVPMPTTRPSSMTTIRSALQDRADPLGDDDHRRAAELPAERRPQAGVGREVERREAVVEDVDRRALRRAPGRSRAAGAGRRRRSCRPG